MGGNGGSLIEHLENWSPGYFKWDYLAPPFLGEKQASLSQFLERTQSTSKKTVYSTSVTMFCYTCLCTPPSRLHRQCRGEEYGACAFREQDRPARRRPRDGLRRPCPEGTVRPPRHRRKSRDRRGAWPTVGREERRASQRRHCASRGGHARAPLLPACAAVHGATGMWRRRDGCAWSEKRLFIVSELMDRAIPRSNLARKNLQSNPKCALAPLGIFFCPCPNDIYDKLFPKRKHLRQASDCGSELERP